MTQRVLPFKLESTNDIITAHAGLGIFGEFIHAMGLPKHINRTLPKPGSPRGYEPSKFIEPLILTLHGGGRSLEDIRQIKRDTGLQDLLRIDAVPSPDATGDWLRRMGSGHGLDRLGKINRAYIRRGLNFEKESDFTLDIDATQIVAEKQDAFITYKGEKGYMPMVGHLAENGLVIGDEFREGNVSPGARNLEFIQYCCDQMPKGKKISFLRADSATYQADVFNFCEQKHIKFAIGGRLDSATMSAIDKMDDDQWKSYGDKKVAETVHSMEKTKKAFRLIIIKRPVQQTVFFDDNEPERIRYTVIATNKTESMMEVIKWYNKRGDTSENRIKDLKIGFGMERMPCGSFAANSMFFRIGVLAYNLFVLFKLLALPSSMKKHQVQTIRWRLYQTAGKIVKHAGALYLKVSRLVHDLFAEIRTRNYEVMVM
jgi:hypothetical protein